MIEQDEEEGPKITLNDDEDEEADDKAPNQDSVINYNNNNKEEDAMDVEEPAQVANTVAKEEIVKADAIKKPKKKVIRKKFSRGDGPDLLEEALAKDDHGTASLLPSLLPLLLFFPSSFESI